jgi:alkanesulfonate monooxygenase SsuD/methylene tetrahydromethanopterin reductase-like flavin-dependent oxidoreductase (luciferase family)
MAKMAASIDDISGGRMILAIGAGDSMSEREQEVFGLPVYRGASRRQHLVETVSALKNLWSGEPFPGGEYVPAMSGPLLPKPVTPGGPPIWVGGASENAVRCAASIADGWNGWGMSPDLFADRGRLLSSLNKSAEPTWSGLAPSGSWTRIFGPATLRPSRLF